MFMCQYVSDLSNDFKCHVNEFKLRRHGITNQNTFRCSGRTDETAKQGRNCKCHYLSAFKQQN